MAEFKVSEKCKPCGGTGLYVGLAERDGASVVCYKCKGTGCYEFSYQYEEFTGKKMRQDVNRVLETNVGIIVGNGKNCKVEDFGGVSYSDWLKDGKFPKGTEMRNASCPAWWNQSVGSKRLNWDECLLGGSFNQCSSFCSKEKCWEKFDNQ